MHISVHLHSTDALAEACRHSQRTVVTVPREGPGVQMYG